MANLSFVLERHPLHSNHHPKPLDELSFFNIKAEITQELENYIKEINCNGGSVVIMINDDRNTYSYRIIGIEDPFLIEALSKDLNPDKLC
jgi:hypothetical protein